MKYVRKPSLFSHCILEGNSIPLKKGKEMKIAMVDNETTGTDPKECHIVELGVLILDPETWVANEHPRGVQHQIRLKPPVEIPPEAMAVHDITNEDVAGCMSAPEARGEIEPWFEGVDMIVAHHLHYDGQLLVRVFPGMIDRYRDDPHGSLCTLRLAQRFFPDAPSHKLQALKYRLRLWGSDKSGCDLLAPGGAHSSLYDCHVATSLLHHIVFNCFEEGTIVERVLRAAKLSREPLLLKYIHFGKHRDSTFVDVAETDPSYMQWLAKQDWVKDDSDLNFTVKHYVSQHFINSHRK